MSLDFLLYFIVTVTEGEQFLTGTSAHYKLFSTIEGWIAIKSNDTLPNKC